jgi:iron complex outermembrane recepter protein
MLKLNNTLPFLIIIFISHLSFGQKCTIKIHGRAIDEVTGAPLSYATVFLEKSAKGVSADEEGYFQFDNLCPDTTHIRVSHVSCEPLRSFIIIEKDTVLNLFLHHHEELMDEILVHGNKDDLNTENSSTLDKDLISREGNKSLGNLLEDIAGVSALKTGSGIFKPVIHGLYGNRIAILNNGVALAGQQWGNDHAPEIDPFSADHISVVKGVGALAYSGSSLGGVVLVEPAKIKEDPHMHGTVNYLFESNGYGHVLNAEVSKYSKKISWKLNATGKGIGDQKTPNYFLTNTGRKEANASLQIDKDFGQWKSNLYFTTFNSEIGILRGSHIGNLSDLESAFQQTVPFFTKDEFSYQIESPSQKVNHQLLKLKTAKRLSENANLNLIYAGQLNQRKEFDVRRSGRSDIAALSLLQMAHFLESSYDKSLSKKGFLKVGIQWDLKNNTNNPETGILPLIPDYISTTSSIYSFYQKELNKSFFEVGGRFDYQQLNVVRISRDLPREIERFNHKFPNYSFAAGLRQEISPYLKFNLNAGMVKRAPAINELYSFGLHQGVSSIEIGNQNLTVEQSIKLTASLDLAINHKFYFQALAYFQSIQDYIYLKPDSEYILTIRGAFPQFHYSQTDARLIGMDFLMSFEPFEKLRWVSKAAILKGDDVKNGIPLVYMPSNNLSNTVTWALGDCKKLVGNTISVEHKVVFKQNHLNEKQDYLVTPNTYQISNLGFNSSVLVNNHTLSFGLKVENIFNSVYRDYLNRQRYFADELGRNVKFRMNYKF